MCSDCDDYFAARNKKDVRMQLFDVVHHIYDMFRNRPILQNRQYAAVYSSTDRPVIC